MAWPGRRHEEIDRLDLPRIQDDDELDTLKASQALVPIRLGPSLRVDPRLEAEFDRLVDRISALDTTELRAGDGDGHRVAANVYAEPVTNGVAND